VTKISFTGYSLGGVIARYVLGILHQRRFFDTVQPVNYTSIATPHLGLPKYDTFFGKLSRTLGPKLLSRTGTQFFATDAWGPRGRPLVEVMSDPSRSFAITLDKVLNLLQIKYSSKLLRCSLTSAFTQMGQ
jgi:hypothetical protein